MTQQGSPNGGDLGSAALADLVAAQERAAQVRREEADERRRQAPAYRWAEAIAGPAVRRAKREWQWRRGGAHRRLAHVGAAGFDVTVAAHRTPLFRELAGLEQRLQVNKVTNLTLAAQRIDGLELAPGQRFSFWRQVGAPTARRGFLPGLVLDAGTLTEGVGGGLCQATNLLYWMTLHTPLTVVERWRHTYDVFPDNNRTQPFASGATCSYPSLDLQIQNDTNVSYRLRLEVTRTELRGSWSAPIDPGRRYEVYEANHLVTHEGPGVFVRRNALRRKVFAYLSGPNGGRLGEQLDDEFITENHALMMYQPFLPSC